jgi:tRNA dimethylallyltransferase
MKEAQVIALVGATATGKTAVAETLAASLDAEIVCCDSRQLFRELEIGTGKPAPAERAARPHHLFEALALEERASAGRYAALAAEACRAIHARGRPALLVGGSGLYLAALMRGLSPEPAHAPEVRRRVRETLAAEGPEALHRRLAAVDPATAARLEPRDRQRIARALEVYESSGRPLSWWHARPTGPALAATWRIVELTVAPEALDERIARRTRAMFDGGLIEETRALLDAGRGEALARLRAVGYDEAIALIEKRIDRGAAETATNRRTRQLAKRQRTWFRHQVQAGRLDATSAGPEVLARAILTRS